MKWQLPETRWASALEKQRKLLSVLLLILALAVIGEIFIGGIFTATQALSTLKYASYTAMFALCQMIVIAGGGNALQALGFGFPFALAHALLLTVLLGFLLNFLFGGFPVAAFAAFGGNLLVFLIIFIQFYEA